MLFHILPLLDCFVALLRAMTESIMLIVVIISKLNIKSKDMSLLFIFMKLTISAVRF